MTIDKKYIDMFHDISVKAAFDAYHLVGKKDKIAADKAAVDSMRKNLNKIKMKGQIVIGEGELDEAPMLYIGEKLGTGDGPELDIAVDPLEGTNFVANNLPGALSVIAVAEKSNLLNAPETYMDKIAISSSEKGIVDLDNTVTKNISDGDISGALLVTKKDYNIDIFLGIGGGPEGVLAASALDAYGCFFQGRFLFDNENDKIRAKKMGINNFEKKYELNEIVSGDSIFCATGITSGDLVNGIDLNDKSFKSETLITHKSSGIKKTFKLNHNI